MKEFKAQYSNLLGENHFHVVLKETFLAAPDVSFAAKQMLRLNENRDVVDVLNDLEALTEFFSVKLNRK